MKAEMKPTPMRPPAPKYGARPRRLLRDPHRAEPPAPKYGARPRYDGGFRDDTF